MLAGARQVGHCIALIALIATRRLYRMPNLACAAASARRASTRCVFCRGKRRARWDGGMEGGLCSAPFRTQAMPACSLHHLQQLRSSSRCSRGVRNDSLLCPPHLPPRLSSTLPALQRGPVLHLLRPQPQRRPGHHAGHLSRLVPRHGGLGGGCPLPSPRLCTQTPSQACPPSCLGSLQRIDLQRQPCLH